MMPDPARATTGPLQGRRILVTRARAQAGDLIARLRLLGAEPVECAAIAIAAPATPAPLDAAIARLAEYDWIIFSSANGVSAFVDRLATVPGARAALRAIRLAAIGPATAQALAAAGLPADFVPEAHVAEALVAGIHDVAGRRILLPQAAMARPMLADGLRARGALVDVVAAYETRPAPDLAVVAGLLREGRVDALTFTSSSTVRYLVQALAAAGLTFADLPPERRPAIVCIGPITATTAQAHGLPVDAVAEDYTTAGLIAALTGLFAATGASGRN